MAVFGGQGISLSLGGQGTNAFTLQAGEAWLIPPGVYNIQVGPYSTVQAYDPITTIWRSIGSDTLAFKQISSDGVNYRVANQSGCVVGAAVTTAGSLYVTAPTVNIATTGAKAIAIVGGAVTVSPTVTNGGTSYLYPPEMVIAAPPSPGVQATGYSVLTSGVVTSVVILNQGAGYLTPPAIGFVNDPRDTTGSGASAVATLTGGGTVTAVLVTDHGNPTTTVPAITFTATNGGSSAAATALMDFTVTAYVASFPGAGFAGSYEVRVSGSGMPALSGNAYTNPATQQSLVRPRSASIIAALTSTGLYATGQVVLDGGVIGGTTATATNILLIGGAGLAPTTAGTLTLTLGGANDFIYALRA
jgi:hypothetical protein